MTVRTVRRHLSMAFEGLRDNDLRANGCLGPIVRRPSACIRRRVPPRCRVDRVNDLSGRGDRGKRCWSTAQTATACMSIGGVNIENGERSGSGDRSNWQVRLATMAGAGAGAAVGLLWRTDLGGFWQGLTAFGIVTGVGAVLGRFVGGLLFRPASGGPPGPSAPRLTRPGSRLRSPAVGRTDTSRPRSLAGRFQPGGVPRARICSPDKFQRPGLGRNGVVRQDRLREVRNDPRRGGAEEPVRNVQKPGDLPTGVPPRRARPNQYPPGAVD